MSWREHFQVNIDENEMYDEHNYFNNEESIFETDTVFSSRDELLDWVRKTGYSVGYVVVIKTSKSNESVTIQCDRSGISISKKKSTKNTGSKKCGCPFELVGKYLPSYNGWMLVVICETHNHEPALYLEGHSYARRCQLRTSYGLPCSHEQAMYLFNGQPLPLDVVDAFWKKLDFSPCISLGDNQDCEAELEKLNAEFNKQFGLPSTTSFPRMFHAFIDRVQDVKADGNCGFRATAVGLGLHEDEWPTIRYRLLQELGMHSQQYVSMFGVDGYNHVRDRLNFFNIDECAPMIKWMSMPEIGILIASHFNVILHTITNLGARKATRTCLGDASVQRPNTEAEKLQEHIYGMTQWVSGKANKIGITLAAVLFLGIQNAGAVPPVIDTICVRAEVGEGQLIGHDLVQETTKKISQTKDRLKVARNRQKSYADKRRKPLEFSVGDYVLLKVSPWKGVVRFVKKWKLAPRFVGPFENVEKVGPVAYRLDLPEELSGVHDTFHVSNLKKCLVDPTLKVPLDEIRVDAKLNFVEDPVEFETWP
ncbi:hypothetical protein Tco_0473150 [Tanacetum coccineum]